MIQCILIKEMLLNWNTESVNTIFFIKTDLRHFCESPWLTRYLLEKISKLNELLISFFICAAPWRRSPLNALILVFRRFALLKKFKCRPKPSFTLCQHQLRQWIGSKGSSRMVLWSGGNLPNPLFCHLALNLKAGDSESGTQSEGILSSIA